MRTWLRTYGFPLFVLAGLSGASYLAARARVPDPVPAFALQAAAVYRLEVGAACFVVIYLAAMAFFLALEGRGFAELGTRGLRAARVVGASDTQQVILSRLMKASQEMERNLQRIDATLENATNSLNEQERRLQALDEERLI
jgi:hypothetical protein